MVIDAGERPLAQSVCVTQHKIYRPNYVCMKNASAEAVYAIENEFGR